MLWGNGGCSADATGQGPFLQQLASYGVLIIASGTPKGTGQTTSAVMKQSIDWITQQAGKGTYSNIDASRIVAAGFSCGGIEAYDQIWDSRVMGIGIWSSGLLNNQTAAKSYTKPIFYFLGGSTDIAYANVSAIFHRTFSLLTLSRANAIMLPSQLACRNGKATSKSVTAGRTLKRMVESSVRSARNGYSGICVAIRRRRFISPARAQRMMGGPLFRPIWLTSKLPRSDRRRYRDVKKCISERHRKLASLYFALKHVYSELLGTHKTADRFSSRECSHLLGYHSRLYYSSSITAVLCPSADLPNTWSFLLESFHSSFKLLIPLFCHICNACL